MPVITTPYSGPVETSHARRREVHVRTFLLTMQASTDACSFTWALVPRKEGSGAIAGLFALIAIGRLMTMFDVAEAVLRMLCVYVLFHHRQPHRHPKTQKGTTYRRRTTTRLPTANHGYQCAGPLKFRQSRAAVFGRLHAWRVRCVCGRGRKANSGPVGWCGVDQRAALARQVDPVRRRLSCPG